MKSGLASLNRVPVPSPPCCSIGEAPWTTKGSWPKEACFHPPWRGQGGVGIKSVMLVERMLHLPVVWGMLRRAEDFLATSSLSMPHYWGFFLLVPTSVWHGGSEEGRRCLPMGGVA